MPTKKTTKKVTKENNLFDFQKLVNGSDSYKSLIYGIVTVVVLFVVIALGIRTLQQNKAQIDNEALSTAKLNLNEGGKNMYTVVEGDTLWSIAEKNYKDGNRWGEIAKANNITDASALEKGTKLTIPNAQNSQVDTTIALNPTAQVSPTVAVTPTVVVSPTNVVSPTATLSPAPTKAEQTTPSPQQVQKITGTDYKIISGDTLWDISIKAYGNGYRWVEIAQVNNLQNPDLIYAGNSLKLPRP